MLYLVRSTWQRAWRYPLETVETMTAISQVLSTLEQLGGGERKNGGINDWQYTKALHPTPGRVTQALSSEVPVKIILLARLAASTSLCFSRSNTSRMLGTAVVAASHLIGGKYTLNGGDGAEQLGAISHAAASLGRVGGGRNKDLAIAFIGWQTVLSYFVSGFTKTFGREWTNGTALERVIRTHTYGDARFYRFLRRHPRVGQLLTYATVLIETAFPVLVLHRITRKPALCIMGLFHLANAKYMGLGRFFVSFVSTYPAVVKAVSR